MKRFSAVLLVSALSLFVASPALADGGSIGTACQARSNPISGAGGNIHLLGIISYCGKDVTFSSRVNSSGGWYMSSRWDRITRTRIAGGTRVSRTVWAMFRLRGSSRWDLLHITQWQVV